MTRPVSVAPHIGAKSGFSRLKCRTALIIAPFHIPFTFFPLFWGHSLGDCPKRKMGGEASLGTNGTNTLNYLRMARNEV